MICDCSYMPLHHPRKSKSKSKEKKRNIKSRKINKKKRNILVFKYTMTMPFFLLYHHLVW